MWFYIWVLTIPWPIKKQETLKKMARKTIQIQEKTAEIAWIHNVELGL